MCHLDTPNHLVLNLNKMLTIIAAASENNALGKDNQLVWHLPDDFKRFKTITSGHYIVMGRKTSLRRRKCKH